MLAAEACPCRSGWGGVGADEEVARSAPRNENCCGTRRQLRRGGGAKECLLWEMTALVGTSSGVRGR